MTRVSHPLQKGMRVVPHLRRYPARIKSSSSSSSSSSPSLDQIGRRAFFVPPQQYGPGWARHGRCGEAISLRHFSSAAVRFAVRDADAAVVEDGREPGTTSRANQTRKRWHTFAKGAAGILSAIALYVAVDNGRRRGAVFWATAFPAFLHYRLTEFVYDDEDARAAVLASAARKVQLADTTASSLTLKPSQSIINQSNSAGSSSENSNSSKNSHSVLRRCRESLRAFLRHSPLGPYRRFENEGIQIPGAHGTTEDGTGTAALISNSNSNTPLESRFLALKTWISKANHCYLESHIPLHSISNSSSPSASPRDAAFKALHDFYSPRVEDLCLRLRGMYLKNAQFLSLRDDMVPPEYLRWCRKLQHMAPTVLSTEQARAIVDREVGLEKFEKINFDTPAGSAAIGVVYEGWIRVPIVRPEQIEEEEPEPPTEETDRTPTRLQRVAIKVQIPGGEAQFRSDLLNMKAFCMLAYMGL